MSGTNTCSLFSNLFLILGFWIKRSTYEEQPVVRFQYQTLLVAATSTRGEYVAWSTFPQLNNMLGANLRIPAVTVRMCSQHATQISTVLMFSGNKLQQNRSCFNRRHDI